VLMQVDAAWMAHDRVALLDRKKPRGYGA